MAFVKLSDRLLDSSLWFHDHDVVRVFIFLLLKARPDGWCSVTIPAIAHQCLIPLERAREILDILESPDPDSRTAGDDGRRIAVIREPEFRIKIINYQKYREMDYTHAERQRRYRERKRDAVTPSRDAVTSSRDSVTPSRVTQAEAEEEADRNTIDIEKVNDIASMEIDADRGGSRGGKKGDCAVTADAATTPPLPINRIIMTFPTVGKVKEWHLYESYLDELQELYPHLDVLGEIRKALAWVKAKPDRRKTARGMPDFIVKWLNRATDSGRGLKRNENGGHHPMLPPMEEGGE